MRKFQLIRPKYFFLFTKPNQIYQFNYRHKFSRYAGQISKKFLSKNAFVDVVTFIFVSTNPGENVFFAQNNITSNRRTWTKINVNQLNSIIVVCCFPRTFSALGLSPQILCQQNFNILEPFSSLFSHFPWIIDLCRLKSAKVIILIIPFFVLHQPQFDQKSLEKVFLINRIKNND